MEYPMADRKLDPFISRARRSLLVRGIVRVSSIEAVTVFFLSWLWAHYNIKFLVRTPT
jgi:hypothetical protein